MANCFFLASVVILNGGLATLIVSCGQICYRQLPQPPPRPAFAALALSVGNDTQELLGSPQGLLGYASVLGILDNVTGRHRSVGQYIAQELHSLATGVGVLLLARCG